MTAFKFRSELHGLEVLECPTVIIGGIGNDSAAVTHWRNARGQNFIKVVDERGEGIAKFLPAGNISRIAFNGGNGNDTLNGGNDGSQDYRLVSP
jgi:hypothetical protein